MSHFWIELGPTYVTVGQNTSGLKMETLLTGPEVCRTKAEELELGSVHLVLCFTVGLGFS